MSSAATLTFDADTIGISPDAWAEFCAEHQLEHRPQVVGGNVWYCGQVQLIYALHRLSVSTFWGGDAMPDVARLALAAWQRWGGSISADPEIRARFAP